jgi:hypothetical protein
VETLAVEQVALERVLCGNGHGLEVELEVAGIDPLCTVAEQRAERPGEEGSQLDVRERCERADRLDTRTAKSRLGTWPDAREDPHRQRREESSLRARGDDRDASGLPPVGGDLADDLGGPDAERAGQARAAAHGRLDGGGDRASPGEVVRDRAEVEVALVDPRPLDAGNDLADRVPDDPRVLAVERVPRSEEHGVRAAAKRLGRAHCRVDPERPRRVVRGRYHSAPMRISTDDQRLVAKRRILELLDRGEEGVEVEMGEDLHAGKATVGA